MKRFSDVIEKWPTVADFAREVGVPYGRARKWRDRNSIPYTYWRVVVGAASERGFEKVSLECLAKLKSGVTESAA